MSKELMLLIDQISRDKGLPRGVLLEAIRSALLSAAKKKYGGKENLGLDIDEKTFEINLYEFKNVVEEPEDPEADITLEEGKKLDPEVEIGGQIIIPMVFQDFGRIAAQTAKQVIFQRVREAERDIIYNEYKDKVGEMVSGTVMRREKGAYYVNIGKTDAILANRDTLVGESLKRGDMVKGLIEEIRNTSKGPAIVISRTKPEFVSELFKMEVPEIAEGLVKIKDVVREPGERTKIAVYSTTPSVDPVGACVGMKGTRVQSIVRELRGERIDIIPWIDDLRMLIARALSPATIERVGIVEEDKTAMVVVADQHLSVAIGKKGQNVRLAMKLTGWDIDIMSETEYSKLKMEEADQVFAGSGEAQDAQDEGEAAEDELADEAAEAPEEAEETPLADAGDGASDEGEVDGEPGEPEEPDEPKEPEA
ncbi:MAG: transcription termination/antitermination protein NusA [Thermodesulfovibrionales bacterium]|nr:transcription termination/antitermination protein NusA [Thermodesulfovibrionales bacterium]